MQARPKRIYATRRVRRRGPGSALINPTLSNTDTDSDTSITSKQVFDIYLTRTSRYYTSVGSYQTRGSAYVAH